MFLHPIVIQCQSPLCVCDAWCDKKKESQMNVEPIWHKKKVSIMGNSLILFQANFGWLWIYHGAGYIGKRRMGWITLCNGIRIWDYLIHEEISLPRRTGYEPKDLI